MPPRSRAIISGPAAGWYPGAFVSPGRKRRHLFGCSWEHATHHPETRILIPQPEYLVRGIAGCDYSIRNPHTTESADARAAAPAVPSINGHPATTKADRSGITGPIGPPLADDPATDLTSWAHALSRNRIHPPEEAC